jgi:hypothetical protein
MKRCQSNKTSLFDPLKGSGQVDRLVSFGPPVFLWSNLP